MKTLILMLTLTFSLFAQHEWSEPVQLSEMGISPGTSYTKPVIASNSNGNIYCFWTKNIQIGTENKWYSQVEYRKSTDNGITWSATENITPESTADPSDRIYYLKAVCDSENNVHVIYMKGLGFDTNIIIYKMYNGISWTEPYTITSYSVSHLQATIDKEDRIYIFWVLNGYQYYTYSDKSEYRVWQEPNSFESPSVNWAITNSNFIYDSDNNLYVAGMSGGNTGDTIRPCLYSYNKSEEKWNDFEEIGSFTSTTSGCGLVILSDGKLVANVSVGSSIFTNSNYLMSKDIGTLLWSVPIYINNNTHKRSKKMFTDRVDNIHLIERYIIDSRSELIYSYTKGNTWYTETVQADGNKSFGNLDAEFDSQSDRIFLVFTAYDNLNSNATCNYFQTKLIDTGIDITSDIIIKGYRLFQNYPNPFNSSTQIKFTLPKTSDVRLSVYNIKGEFVKDLIYSKQSKGQYSVTFEAGNLNSGIYYYQLVIDGIISETKKMLYLK